MKKIGGIKNKLTIEELGYSVDDFKLHIESLFTNGMYWDNHGDWEIHHIKFISQFDKDTPPDVVNSLDNLIPLWKNDHYKKHKKYHG